MIDKLLDWWWRHRRRPQKRNFAQGGYIGPSMAYKDSMPIQLFRGCVYMTATQYNNLGPDTIAALYPNSDVEIIYTADEVRELGVKILKRM